MDNSGATAAPHRRGRKGEERDEGEEGDNGEKKIGERREEEKKRVDRRK